MTQIARTQIGTALACVALLACGSSELDKFEQNVAPLLEGYCLGTACHGVLPDAEERGEVIDWNFFHVRVETNGRIVDIDQAYAAAKARINKLERPEFSTLLRKPLAVEHGGQVHQGGVQFANRDQAAFQALLDWIEQESEGGEGEKAGTLTENQQLFRDEVLPQLTNRQCMNQACHGPFAPFTAFVAPMSIEGEMQYPAADALKNYKAARLHLALGGQPLQSRLIRKGLPLHLGGIIHRGGNDIFFLGVEDEPLDDPAVAAIVAWAEAEQAAISPPVTGELAGVVFVRGPASPALPFSHNSFAPGSDLFVVDSPLEPPQTGTARNLTATAHPGKDADVRDPTVNHAGTKIAFAMRKDIDDALNIYEIGVDGSGLSQLTTDVAALPGGGFAGSRISRSATVTSGRLSTRPPGAKALIARAA